jgi:hypothetical protein
MRDLDLGSLARILKGFCADLRRLKEAHRAEERLASQQGM